MGQEDAGRPELHDLCPRAPRPADMPDVVALEGFEAGPAPDRMKSLCQRRPGRLFIWSAAALVLGFGSLILCDYYAREHPPDYFAGNETLLHDLKGRPLTENVAADLLPGPWPQWRGPRRDGVSPERGLLTSWPKGGPRVLWRADCGEGYSALAVAGGGAFTLWRDGKRGKEVIVCWDAAGGAERWRHEYDCKVRLPYGNGPRSTPTVDGERVYAVGATGVLHCLDTATGKVLWRKDLLDEYRAPGLPWGVAFSPLIEGDLLLTNPGGPNGNSIVALDKRTGEKVWGALDDPAAYSSPLAGTLAGVRQLIFFTGRGLVGLSPERGKLYWHHPWETTDHGVNVATPIALDDYLFISSGYGKGCALLKVQKDGPDGLKAEEVYSSTAMCNHFSSSVLYKEHLYGFSDPGILTCMDFRTGGVRWRKRGLGKGSLTVADGLLILLGESGQLALADAAPEGYRERAACRVCDDRTWAVPVLADGRLYVRTPSEVLCFDVKSPEGGVTR